MQFKLVFPLLLSLEVYFDALFFFLKIQPAFVHLRCPASVMVWPKAS